MRISDWSSDVCSSDLPGLALVIARTHRLRAVEQPGGQLALLFDCLGNARAQHLEQPRHDDHDRRAHLLDVRGELLQPLGIIDLRAEPDREMLAAGMFVSVGERQEREEYLVVPAERSEEHTSELQSLMRISYAVFCL